MDIAERTQDTLHVLLLDWEKAFDKITHSSLIHTLRRYGLPEKLVQAVSSIYTNPTFAVKITGRTSAFKQQHSGIRQGCPLSPYLFLAVLGGTRRVGRPRLNWIETQLCSAWQVTREHLPDDDLWKNSEYDPTLASLQLRITAAAARMLF